MRNTENQKSRDFYIFSTLLLFAPWTPTIYMWLTGNHDAIPMCGSISATLDVVALTTLKAIKS